MTFLVLNLQDYHEIMENATCGEHLITFSLSRILIYCRQDGDQRGLGGRPSGHGQTEPLQRRLGQGGPGLEVEREGNRTEDCMKHFIYLSAFIFLSLYKSSQTTNFANVPMPLDSTEKKKETSNC